MIETLVHFIECGLCFKESKERKFCMKCHKEFNTERNDTLCIACALPVVRTTTIKKKMVTPRKAKK